MKNERWVDNFSTAPRYNTKVVVRETGVPADTFRAWERRYGTPVPQRTETGQRLYSDRDIAVIRWLRDRTAEGLTISHAVRLLEGDAEAVQAVKDPPAWNLLESHLVDALLRLQTAAAEAILAEAFAYYPLDDVCLKLISPVLVTIGSGWEAGTITIGQEHFATQLLRRKLQGLFGVYDIVVGQATIVAACPPGEQHDTGLLILSLLLVRRGYRVVYLGANTPIDGLLPVVEQVNAEIVCLSAASAATAAEIPAMAEALSRLQRPPLLVAGGQGILKLADHDGLYLRLASDTLQAVSEIIEAVAHRRAASDAD